MVALFFLCITSRFAKIYKHFKIYKKLISLLQYQTKVNHHEEAICLKINT